ncbi:MAG: acyl-[acyl-carrier-protein]--UDP-N-acetylglucosam ine O-acyltransferase [Phycisphaerae bacterium]|nr:MAG: acyl-[acyl-carrier-protein]--UDP-N-acetylglucosam ine O-acyltransferase [Phycisphaerae bacterium]
MIHPSAVIDTQAILEEGVEVGPYAVIDGPVRIGEGTRVCAHAHVEGDTVIGRECVIHPFACVGGPPQDLAYDGARSLCRVGDRTIVREGVTIHRGTSEGSITQVGNDCMLMSNSHVAHDCAIEDHVVMSSGVLLAGHVTLCHHAVLGGAAMVQQFGRIGEYTMISGATLMTRDAAPFLTYSDRCFCHGVNRVGMRRGGFDRESIDEVRHLHRKVFRETAHLHRAAQEMAGTTKTKAGERFLQFIMAESKRGIGASRRRGIGKNSESVE